MEVIYCLGALVLVAGFAYWLGYDSGYGRGAAEERQIFRITYGRARAQGSARRPGRRGLVEMIWVVLLLLATLGTLVALVWMIKP